MSKISILNLFEKRYVVNALKKQNVINLILDINDSTCGVSYIVFFKYRNFIFSKAIGYAPGLYEKSSFDSLEDLIQNVSKDLEFFTSYIDKKILLSKKTDNETRFLIKSSLFHTFSFLIKDAKRYGLFDRQDLNIDKQTLFKKYESLLKSNASAYFVAEMFFEDLKLCDKRSIEMISNYVNEEYEKSIINEKP